MKRKIWSALLSSITAGVFGYCVSTVFCTEEKVWPITIAAAVIGVFLSDSAWDKLSMLLRRFSVAAILGVLGWGAGLEIAPDGIVIPIILSAVCAVIGFILGKNMRVGPGRW